MSTENYRKYCCITCDMIYDEALGMPEEGIAPGTRFEDIPDDWTCPECSASKSDFYLVE
ncbi:rubredoxin [Oleiphilus sp. HI0086]|uniref:rubredoxin n=1 Tax=unclassified Oleiphilus TaxID=2631174 RepID=UPI0007C2A9FA|nr:rubredoxin [Oleiphilus sp. HI0043]KZY41994.1 rubredoxin [Oleiphilus sp. HI0050]KZY65130.1 rubredoxin [Oleiphilus sp. HI0061]KZY79398.1 rubredoxin [Oleiphilus sp. HI0068]KZY87614.1 rubredoxin [Oleiphilus sp. HI0069]KZY89871.1 rubredoxin [Oleiphilus sp. HI0072]KZZ17192.1 rubredoxin [Oleiphilus sp. HI0078]KZZ20685.1 rubredoxin [Oleiphilus sp. HI0081]KZZ32835.1 rubredoxin [Oleiphilus sp. HI0117]KZZ32856.1 rubredoxin [Oleiphilus sp. HI0086]KZZ47758.1 rubredoxin [Oleiphilus sp. HI0085]KZZ54